MASGFQKKLKNLRFQHGDQGVALIEFKNAAALGRVVGIGNDNLEIFSEVLGEGAISIKKRGDHEIEITGDDKDKVRQAADVLKILRNKSTKAVSDVSPEMVRQAFNISVNKTEEKVAKTIARNFHPRTPNQEKMVADYEVYNTMLAVGPAGTGKTTVGVALAVHDLLSHKVNNIVLIRPAVEAGERLGYLPGSLQEKVDPYLRPLFDALYKLMNPDLADSLIERKIIEVAPLAFLRGRTFENAVVIVDEAQNITEEQAKMIVTRQGYNSKFVLCGDLTQNDLPIDRKTGKKTQSGLKTLLEIAKGIDDVSVIEFDAGDNQRLAIVEKWIRGFEAWENGTFPSPVSEIQPKIQGEIAPALRLGANIHSIL